MNSDRGEAMETADLGERRASDPHATRLAAMAPILCRGANIAEHVAAMFDALVGSLDWGSGFLDTETIESILIVAELAGFDVSGVHVHVPDESLALPAMPPYAPPYNDPVAKAAHQTAWAERERVRVEAIAAWRKQVQAKARAMADRDAKEQENA